MNNRFTFRHLIFAILLLIGCMPVLAQTTEDDDEEEYSPHYFNYEHIQVCNSQESYRWHNMTYFTSGTYKDTVPSGIYAEPSTVYTLYLEFTDTIDVYRKFQIVKGTYIVYRGKKFSEEGEYTDTTKATVDCDTVYHIVIQWDNNFHRYDTVHVCHSEFPYRWNDRIVHRQGDTTFVYPCAEYDSIIHLHVKEHKPIERSLSKVVCKNDLPYIFGPHEIWNEGTYSDTMQNVYGCTEITHLTVTLGDLAYSKKVVYFCPSEGAQHRDNFRFYEHRTYFDTIPRAQQCDSVDEVEYIPIPSFYQETYGTHFEGDPYVWAHNGVTYTKDGTYVDRYISSTGCDSVYTLRLTTVYEVPVTIPACQGDTLLYKGKLITDKTPFPIRDTMKTVKYGADSVLLVTYLFYPRYYFLERTSLCYGEKVEWTGHTYADGSPIILSEGGSYFDRKETVHGCDSIYEIQVERNLGVAFDTTIVVCNDSLENFRWTDAYGKERTWAIADVDTTIIEIMDHTPVLPQSDYQVGDVWYRALSGGCPVIWKMRLVAKACGNDTIPICAGSTKWVNGVEYNLPGNYTQRFATSSDVNAIDSILRLHLYEVKSYYSEDYDTARICASEVPYLWYSRRLRRSGIYHDTLTSVEGCDSIVHLHLEVLKTYYTEEPTRNICPDDTTRIHGRLIKENGTYLDTLMSQQGCDSVIRFSVNIVRQYFIEQSDHFGRGTYYKWHRDGHTIYLNQPGVYFDSCRTVVDGCDSIYRLTLIEDQPYYFHDSVYVCEDDLPYFWRGREAHSDTLLTDNLMTKHGMDSIFEMKVIVCPSYKIDKYVTRCFGQPFLFKNQSITQSGMYSDTLYAQHGCDSIIFYHVNFMPTYFIEEEAHMLPNTSYDWVGHDTILTSPGIYFDTLTSLVTGCDSIHALKLVEDLTYAFHETRHICQSETPYFWHGYWLSESTDTSRLYVSSELTDSIYYLHLTIHPVIEQTLTFDKCLGESFTFGTHVLTTTGSFTETYNTMDGCDSIVHYFVNFHAPFHQDDSTHIVSGTSIDWHGMTLSQTGVYYDSQKTQNDCDSIYSLKLIEDDKYAFYETRTICQSETPYLWHGYWLNESTDTNKIYISSAQTDSIYYLHLIVNPVKEQTLNFDRCVGEKFIYGTHELTETGSFSETYNTTDGCDNIVHYIVNFHAPFRQNDTLHFADGSSIDWHGMTLNKPDFYYDSHKTQSGCDSIYTLMLIADYAYNFTDSVFVCDSDLPYKWHGLEAMNETVLVDINYTKQGMDSIYKMKVNVYPSYHLESNITLCHGQVYKIKNHQISQSGTYADTLRSMHGCDSITSYRINFLPSYLIEEEAHIRPNGSYTWQGHDTTLTSAGVYFDSLTSVVTGCDSIHKLTIYEDNTYEFHEYRHICQSETPFLWHGYQLYKTTDTSRTYISSELTDSTHFLHLIVDPTKERTIRYDRCAGDEFTIGQHKMTETTTFTDTLYTSDGCDSLIHYIVNFHPVFLQYDTLYFKKGTTVNWHNQTLSHPGPYYDSLLTQTQCDSIYQLLLIETYPFVSYDTIKCCDKDLPYRWHNLDLNKDGEDYAYTPAIDTSYYVHFIVTKSYLFESTVHLYCTGGSYSFFGQHLSEPGTYEKEFTTIHGCDSIYRVHIKQYEDPFTTQQISMCPGQILEVADTMVTHACQFTRTYPSSQGCDSVVLYIINELPVFKRTTRATFCENEVYEWHLHNGGIRYIDKPGVYQDTYPIEIGCDSVFELILTSIPVPEWDTTIYFCPDETFTYKGKIYDTNLDTSFTYRSASGCDSIRHYHFHKVPYCTPKEVYMHCPGSTLSMDGYIIDKDSSYRILINKDTMHRFVVHSYPTYEYTKNIGTYCDSVAYEGETYYARGKEQPTFTVDRFLKSQTGCDSIEHLTMTIYQSAPVTMYQQTISDYSSILFENEQYQKEGVYAQTYHTSHGCDSIIMLDLKVTESGNPGAMQYYYCTLSKQPISVFGKTYHPKSDTIILDTVNIPYSSIKVIRTARVIVEEDFKINQFEPENEVCATNDILFNIVYTTKGALPKKYEFEFLDNEFSAVPKYQSGDINPLSKSLAIKLTGQGTCVHPGVYPYRIRFKGEQCQLSDTTLEGEIIVRYPSSIMEVNWNNVVALLNETANAGGWVFQPPYQWQVWDKHGEDKTTLVAPTNPNQPYIYSNQLENDDRIIVTLKRNGYSMAIPSCEFIFQKVATNGAYPVLVTPTVAKKASYLNVQSHNNGLYQMIDNAGNIYQSGTYSEGEQQIPAPAVEGCYILRLTNDESSVVTQKIIVY